MRTAILKLRVTAGEKAAVEARAAALGVSTSELVRRLVFPEPVTVRIDRAVVLKAAVAAMHGGPAGLAVASGEVEEPRPTSSAPAPASPRAPEVDAPTAVQLAGRCRVPVAIARRWLASGEWRLHWGPVS